MDTYYLISNNDDLKLLGRRIAAQRKAILIILDNESLLQNFEKTQGFQIYRTPAIFHVNKFTGKRILKEGNDVAKYLREEQYKVNF